MSSHRYEDVPRRFKLSGDVRLLNDQFVIPVQVFRNGVYVSTELALLSVDDASVVNAQLTRLLDQRACLGPRRRKDDQSPWSVS
ncbi:hypothetical protein SPAR_09106 [Streptomyces sparsogenes DSM 40356]|uniref:Uncharacterized protein n=1 Tax=Streptomyces sparsogenes DSM 40356 TaxID=1331668 RepID=A0A1R1SNL1_9ACTN|nr:hypothetical protein SPAR_09106 [Streptomyces sparsogenes DSM 40356]